MPAMRIAVAGSAGRMGRTVIEALAAAGDLALGAALEAAASPALGADAGQALGARTGIVVSADFDAGIAASDCLVDFTRPEGTLAHLEACLRHGKAAVIGTTGFDAAGRSRIAGAAERIPIAFAPNFAVGVNVLFKLVDVAARALGDDYDVEIVEVHHRHKVDAPSGTALRLGEIAAAALGRDLARDAVHGRRGDTGERPRRAIGFHAVRGGDIVGEHTVMFAGTGERVELAVRSASRMTYALGALRAARFLGGKAAGLYDMQDVLGLR
ncbi:MAG: 4-hydroxy-tetrahydrodipicolinate reductase [Burkholderiales bacterium]|nr:4-hydroxy-tetrahydrodipicolinate reductase [Burkholderiales bacterium]